MLYSSPVADGKTRQADATHWVALADARDLSPSEQQDLAAWLNADARNLGAYVQAKSVYQALNYRTTAQNERSTAHRSAPTTTRRLFMGSAVAAGLVGLCMPEKVHDHFVMRYRGRQAPQQYVWNGNRVTVDARSGAYFSSSKTKNIMQVADGRIGMEIRRNQTWISAGALKLVGKNTNFDIKLQGETIILSLYAGTMNWLREAQHHAITSPQVFHFSNSKSDCPELIKSHPLTGDALLVQQAWRNGQIILNNSTLQAAVEEFNQYSDTQCLISSNSLNQRKISGSFDLLKIKDFAQAVSFLLGCKTKYEKGKILFYV
ncbi:FecR/PupR family sigma factor regulator [Acetobacter sp. KSO5]|uniref:FecR/PupR family sigma factor regulator n=1 Tax=Acetobacter sp. KSO5 TaxID=3373674 RepID=UPI00376EA130